MTLSPDSWPRLKEVFGDARALPVDRRAAYLDVACGGNQELRDEVESLLASETHAKRFLETPAVLLEDTGAKRLEGQRVGPYQITSGIGAGGMGEVYRAYDATLGRDVAIKILPRIFASDPDRLARFDREARMLASMNHPHIGAIYGVEQSEGAPALVLELVEGLTLADRLATGPILLTESLGIVRQIADALEAAHAKGIIHRDLKPANIKITPDGIVKVLDFGLAKAAASDGIHDLSKSPTVAVGGSHEGVILGTAAYMSPEQARGQTVDKRTDIWAFGCVLYEMLTGRMAFPGNTASDCIAAILERDPDWTALPVPTPLSIRRLLRRCLEKDPTRRLPDIAVARLEIDDAAGDPGGATESATTATLRSRERVWRSATAAAVVIALVTIGVVAWWATRPAPSAAPITFTLPPPEGQLFQTVPGSASRHYSTSGAISVSPDGRSVAFVAVDDHKRFADVETGQAILYVRSLGSQEPQMLSGTDGASYPFWSPDGRFVAFVAGTTLKKIAVAGGPPVTLAENVSGRGAWSSRGVILYRSYPSRQLHRIPDSGGQPMPVTTLDKSRDEYMHALPLFLPDGRRFLFLARTNDFPKSAIYLASLDSESRTRLLDANSQPEYASGYLLYQRRGTVMAQPFDEKQGRLTGEAAPIVEGVDTDPFNGNAAFSVSANGVLIYRMGPGTIGPGRLTWFDRNGKTLGTVAEKGFYRYPRVSPDGRHVVVTFSKDEVRMDLWEIDLDRNVPMRMTTHPDGDFWPTVWSPDSKRVVFSSARAGKNVFDVYQRSASGTAADELLWQTPGEAKSASGFSPDGKILLVDRWLDNSNTSDIWAIPMTGDRKPFPLIETPFKENSAVFSPSGRFIAYVSNDSGANQVYVQPYPPTGTRVQLSSGNGWAPVWTADDRTILYATSDQRLMAVDVTTSGSMVRAGSPRTLFKQRYIGGGLNAFTVDPSGQRFLLVVPDEKAPSPITVVLNWPSLLSKE